VNCAAGRPVWTQTLINGGKYGKMLQPYPPEALRRIVELQHPIRTEQFAERALRAVARNRGDRHSVSMEGAVVVLSFITQSSFLVRELAQCRDARHD
jgi:hypothetical protein